MIFVIDSLSWALSHPFDYISDPVHCADTGYHTIIHPASYESAKFINSPVELIEFGTLFTDIF